ncbi:MAG: lysophospholipid acyltransferase family protein [bacterium]
MRPIEIEVEPAAAARGTSGKRPAHSGAATRPETAARATHDPFARLESRLAQALADTDASTAPPAPQRAAAPSGARARRADPAHGAELDRRIDELLAAAETGVRGISAAGGISSEAMRQVGLVRRLLELVNGLKDLASPTALRSLWRDATHPIASGSPQAGTIDPALAAQLEPLLDFLYSTYWRVEVEGLENVPSEGGAMLVANHAGLLPYDGLMIARAVRRAHPARREVRFLIDDAAYDLPILGPLAARLGGVRASSENAEHWLGAGEVVCVFPEGGSATTKRYRDRYRLQQFGRGGFVSVAMRHRAPLVPTAVIGSEETHPVVTRLDWLGRLLGLPTLPVTPTLPLLGPLGLVPLPSKWRIRFGAPIATARGKRKRADDYLAVSELKDRIRDAIQSQLESTRQSHPSRFFG